jgi:uncharacterized membrane protein
MMMFSWVLLLVVLVVGAAWLAQRSRTGGLFPGADRSEAILRERYARGDIDDATYRRQLAELRGTRSGEEALRHG